MKNNSADKKIFRIGGMDCAGCANTLQKRIAGLPGVSEVDVNFSTAKMAVNYKGDEARLLQAVKQAGFTAEEHVAGRRYEQKSFWKNHPKAITTLAAGLFFMAAYILSYMETVPELAIIGLYAAAIVVGGYRIALVGITGLRTRTVGMELLMSIAAVGAAAIGEWAEGAAVIFLFSFGETLEAYTMDRTRNSIRALMNLTPAEARIRRNDVEMTVAAEDIIIGDVLIVKPGERIAMDGTIIDGHSTVNQAAITGESLPVEKVKGDDVFAGTINHQGALEIKVLKLAKDNTIARIIEMIEEAQSKKAPSQQFVSVFAKYYTPAVIVVAIGIAVVPPLLFAQDFTTWFYRALTMLVVSCPCALVISTPVAIVSAIGNAARNGVLIKGGAYLEQLGALSAIAFDKTGTLTLGVPKVKHVQTLAEVSEAEVIRLAAAVEARSEHPLAQAMLRCASDRGIDWPRSTDFRAYIGRGAVAAVDQQQVYVGNLRLFTDTLGVYLADEHAKSVEDLQQQGYTVMLLGVEEVPQAGASDKKPSIRLLALFGVMDQVREQSSDTMAALRKAGIERIFMFTGDNAGTAEAVSRQLGGGIDYRAELMPEDKVDEVRKLMAQHGHVAMVGDGVNDAPALATATVGIAMGTAGSDTALETADIALMADDLSKLPYTVRLSRRTLNIIKQNIAFALLIKAVFLLMIIPGWVTLWMAVVADTGASILVILNGMRLLRSHSKE
jgi:Cd2+/Zn2+-exporting ATPase